MSSIRQIILITSLFTGIFFSFVVYSGVTQKQMLPRSFGPLTLCMTEKEFKKITGLSTYACEGCGPNEVTAAINVDHYPYLFPKYIYTLAAFERGVDCNFYKGKLYKITFPPEVKKIEVAKRKYSGAFGPPTKSEEWGNGLSWLIWENKITIFSLAYVRKKGDAYPLTLPVGTVASIECVDKTLRNDLDRNREK